MIYDLCPKKTMRQRRATEGALTVRPRRYARLNNIKQQTTPSGQEAEHSTARGSAKETHRLCALEFACVLPDMLVEQYLKAAR